MSRYSASRAAIRRPTPCDTHGRRATRRTAGAYVAIQSLYCDRGPRQRGCDTVGEACDTVRSEHEARARIATRPARPTTWLASPATRPATSHDTAGHRSTTRPRYSWPGCSVCGLCTQAGSGCAHCAPDSVLTQCNVFSHFLEHCS